MVSVHHVDQYDLPNTLCLVCTPMDTFCYNTYICLYTLCYLISATLQDVTVIVADVCMHAADKRPPASNGRDSLSYIFGVTAVWACTCRLYAFWNFNGIVF